MPEYIYRPPRIQPELPSGEIEIPAPPQREGEGGRSLVQVIIPLITIFGYVLIGGRGGSALFILPMALSVIATTFVTFMQFLRARKLDAERQAFYKQRLIDLRKEMRASHDKQRAFYMHNYPDMDAVLRLAKGNGERPSSRLWERRTDDHDFGAVRLGIGSLPSTVIYKPPSSDAEQGPLLMEAIQLAEESLIVHDIPISIPLRPIPGHKEEDDLITLGEWENAIGRYAVGIAGPDRKQTSDFVRAILVNFTAFHSPTDARLYVVGSSDRKADWDWARWLPHTNTSRNEAGKGDQLAFEARKVRRLWDDLQAELERRQLRMQDENAGDVTVPFLLVVVDALNPAADDSPIGAVSTEAAVSLLMTQGPHLGAAVVFVVPERDMIPSECRAVVEAEAIEGTLAFRYAEIGLNTRRYDGDADAIEVRRADQEFARRLAPLAVRTTYGADLAMAVSLMELFSLMQKELDATAEPYDSVDKFPILDWWRHSRKPESSEWLRAPIGLLGGNRVRSLVFAADGDGVHGMIAGTTGSGKSEMLLTLVVGLSMRYDPSVVNFVLADYKGGAAFDPFKTLPHAVDIVSNLQGSAGARTFIAMKAEMNRRSALIANSNTKHIVHYRQKNLHETREPFPFLFIIVDEFAEMVKENPDFKGNLDSITRLGRALGVSLILATQRPAGVVTDQMRANMKWRVCLRVETPEDSRELLKRSDAAFLPNNIPGRAYLQVGAEGVELLQVARAGGPYTGPQIDTEPPVIWLSRGTGMINLRQETPGVEAQALSDVLVEIMHRLADENEDVKPQEKPWPDPLPVKLTLDQFRLPGEVDPNPLLPLNSAIVDWLEEGEGATWHGIDWQERAMRATVGLVDNPLNAEQLPLTIDLTRGHAIIFGASGWGKTVFLRTLITALAATHSPEELHVYMLDFGGRGLDVVAELPHVAATISPSEDDRVLGLMRRLTDEMEQRKTVLAQARVDNLLAYNATHPQSILPAVLVVLDNFAEFRESYEALIPELIAFARDGRANGIHFVITGQQLNIVPNKLYNQFTERLTLKLADAMEYSAIVGRPMIPLAEIQGRGFVEHEGVALEMQVALPVAATPDEEVEGLDDTKKLAALVETMAKAWGDGARPQSIDLSTALSLSELFSQLDKKNYDTIEKFPILEWWEHSRKAENSEWLHAPIGLVTGNKVRTLIFAANDDGSHGMVAGTTGSGKSELLLTVVAGMAMRYDPSVVNFILADYKGGTAFDGFKPLPHAVDIITNLQGTAGARTFTAMQAEMNRRSVMLANTQSKHIVHYRQRNLHTTREPFPFLFIIVDEFAEMVKENPEFMASLDSITRLGRALGLSLILATQRPAGVVNDQMRANMKWRVCLRVETAEDSRELLKRPDAAFLPNTIPGRAYLQVGNENIELMQVARAGGPYVGPLPKYLVEDDESGLAVSSVEAPALSDVLTIMMARLAQESAEVKEQFKPYPDPLPPRMTLADDRLPDQTKPNPLLPLCQAVEDWLNTPGGWPGVDWEEQAMRVNVGLVDHPLRATQYPLEFDFRRGHAAVFGASGWGKTILMRSIVTALAATHSPNELHVYIMDFGGKGLDVLTDLPHVSASVSPSEDDRVQALIRRLNDELDQRKTLLSQARVDNLYQYNATHRDNIVPAILVIIDNFAEFKENYEALIPDLVSITRDGRASGIHFVITAQQLNLIPGKLYNQLTERLTFKLADTGEYGGIIGRSVIPLPEIPGRGYILMDNAALEMQVALPVAATREEQVGGLDDTKKLSRLLIKMAKAWGDGPRPLSIDLVKVLSLSDLFSLEDKTNYDTVESFPILEWWEHSRKAENAEWLRAPVGLITGNKVRTLLFAADGDGSHGMVAGTTGSGKSELLLTVVAGMAMRYDPSVVNFILADYKGGTAFDGFKPLPHAVDILTNLQGTAGARTFTAMKAEMNRRSVLLATTQTKHIVHYRNRNLHETHKPFPFLFIIVDEFAEMVKEFPEFRGSLDSITRLGRALGVSLILATQRPAGVVNDQMRANMKWRICLRVETAEDSRELLKMPDAATLPNSIPGRGYLQVGSSGLELMQVARAGGPYVGPLPAYLRKEQDEEDEAVSAVEAPALSDVLTLMMKHLAETTPEVKPQVKPYPDPLPERMWLGQEELPNQIEPNPLLPLCPVLNDWVAGKGKWRGIDWEKEAMRAKIGLVDNPISASQLTLTLNLARGHAVIFGSSGFGKTTFLRTVVTALAATHSPEELQVYMLDFGGRGLDVLTDMPHVGASIGSTEEERVMRLLRRLENELERRKSILSQARAESTITYNAANPGNILPAILVLIDNFAEFKETYEAQLPDLIGMLRDCRANGIHFVITADQIGSVPGKLYNLLSERLTLKLPDVTEYTMIVGRGVTDLPPLEGRGFVQIERSPLEMQVAMPVMATSEEREQGLDDTKKLGALAATMNKAWGKRARPQPIEILRTIIPLADILPETSPEKVQAYIGTQDMDLEPAAIDLQQRGPHFVVIGPPLSGKTTALRTWVLALASMYDPGQVALVLVDFQQRFYKYGGARTLAELPHVLAAVHEQAQLEEVVKYLQIEYETEDRDFAVHPRPEIFLIADNYDDFANVIGNAATTRSTVYKDLSDMARKYGPEGFHAILGGSLGVMRTMDDFIRQAMAPRFGLGLDASDSPSALGGRVRGAANQAELPPGRGYLVKSGRVAMVQIATPQSDKSMEESLDEWVERICARYPEGRMRWLAELRPELLVVEEAEGEAALEAVGQPAVTPMPMGDLAEAERLRKEMEELQRQQEAAMAAMEAQEEAALTSKWTKSEAELAELEAAMAVAGNGEGGDADQQAGEAKAEVASDGDGKSKTKADTSAEPVKQSGDK